MPLPLIKASGCHKCMCQGHILPHEICPDCEGTGTRVFKDGVEVKVKKIEKIRTCIHCGRSNYHVIFAKKRRVRKSGVFLQITNVCIVCAREINNIRSLRYYYNNKERINKKRSRLNAKSIL
jgi:RecJ-like exonuclease